MNLSNLSLLMETIDAAKQAMEAQEILNRAEACGECVSIGAYDVAVLRVAIQRVLTIHEHLPKLLEEIQESRTLLENILFLHPATHAEPETDE